ncbi:heme-copper oxidase subunit III [Oxalobacteraceae bacterium A2-2]
MNVQAPKTLEVSRLPTFGFGTRSPMWWGTLGLIAIEGMVFALAVMSYFYLRGQAPSWPDGGPAPDLLWGTLNTAVMLASGLPNWWTKRAAERLDLHQVRLGMIVCVAFALVMLALRWLEFGALNVRWDTSAYGSIVWMLMGLHTTHLLTDAYDSIVLAVLLHTGPVEGKRYADASENAAYWYFVLVSWMAVYAVVYWGARF